ncbi:MAG: hypothetical protein AUK48_02400 [Oscillatoriales cyanobacterium CG2_30_44_21]|nr:MAG: hypothetical protein AUK48_02400 [Oscillatoriales cyanobacterium CG2_30_44_21]
MALYVDSSVPANLDPTPSNSATIATRTVGTSSQQLIAANPNRKGFSIFNNSSRIVYLGVTTNVSTTANYFTRIPANSLYEWSFASIYTGAVFAIGNGANAICHVLEITP